MGPAVFGATFGRVTTLVAKQKSCKTSGQWNRVVDYFGEGVTLSRALVVVVKGYPWAGPYTRASFWTHFP